MEELFKLKCFNYKTRTNLSKCMNLFPAMLCAGACLLTRERLEEGWFRNLQNITAIVAFYGDKIVGHAQIFKFPHPRRKGTADLLTYIHQDFQGVGLGTVMLDKLIELAQKEGLHRIGLYMVADNKPAIRLYQKMGFKVEGVMKDAYFGEDGKYHDMLVMGLLLE